MLSRLRNSEEFVRLNSRAAFVVENFGVVGASTGEEMQSLYAGYGQIAAELG